jgi:DNA-binding CsgD family transcriptional regulator
MVARYSASRPHRADLALDIEARLESIPDSGPVPGPAPVWLADSLRELLECEFFLLNRPELDLQSSWRVGEAVSTDDDLLATYQAELWRTARPFNYFPLRPAAAERNHVRMFDEVHTHGPDETCAVEDVWPRIGFGGYDQMRALVCDGPTLLAWVGGVRPQPFTEDDRRVLTELLPSMQRALSLQRRLRDAGLDRATLVQTLEALGVPAFIVRAEGAIVFANEAAAALLDAAPTDTRARLRGALAAPDEASTVARVDARGTPASFLVVLRDVASVLEGRLRAASSRWKLTPRETQVLRWVAHGDANKEIAIRLGCHEGSVERHVTALLRKTGLDSRSRLVAGFWTQT